MATIIKVNGADRTITGETPPLWVLRDLKRHGGLREAATSLALH